MSLFASRTNASSCSETATEQFERFLIQPKPSRDLRKLLLTPGAFDRVVELPPDLVLEAFVGRPRRGVPVERNEVLALFRQRVDTEQWVEAVRIHVADARGSQGLDEEHGRVVLRRDPLGSDPVDGRDVVDVAVVAEGLGENGSPWRCRNSKVRPGCAWWFLGMDVVGRECRGQEQSERPEVSIQPHTSTSSERSCSVSRAA
ncbi:MAG: hypothetical protein GXX96_15540 [Planctomycetaceae bacterium]|nr:hypothetical protein [Planctomycetaceae bacterium]